MEKRVPQTSWTMETPLQSGDVRKGRKMKVNKIGTGNNNIEANKIEPFVDAPLVTKSSASDRKTYNCSDSTKTTYVKVKKFNNEINSNLQKCKVDNFNETTFGSKKAKPGPSLPNLHFINAGRLHFDKDCESTYKLPRKTDRKKVTVKEASNYSTTVAQKQIEPVKEKVIVWKRKSELAADEAGEFNMTNVRKDTFRAEKTDDLCNAKARPTSQKGITTSKLIEINEQLINTIKNELDKCTGVTKSSTKRDQVTSSPSNSSDCGSTVADRVQHLDQMATDLCKMLHSKDSRLTASSNVAPRDKPTSSIPSTQLEESLPVDIIVHKMLSILNEDASKMRKITKNKENSDVIRCEKANLKVTELYTNNRVQNSLNYAHQTKSNSFIKNMVEELPLYYSAVEIEAVIKIQAAFRGYKVRKITRELLRPRGNGQQNRMTRNHVDFFYRGSQVDQGRSLDIPESIYDWNHSKLPSYVKPILNLTESNNINKFLDSSFSLGCANLKKYCSQEAKIVPNNAKLDAIPANRYSRSRTEHRNAQVINKAPNVASVGTVDLLTFEAKRTLIAENVGPPNDYVELRQFPTLTSEKYTITSSTQHNSTNVSDQVSKRSSTIEVDHSFVPHKVKCLAAGDLSRRLNAELLYQDTVSLALSHLKDLEAVNNAPLTADDSMKIGSTSNFYRHGSCQEPNRSPNILENELNVYSLSADNYRNVLIPPAAVQSKSSTNCRETVPPQKPFLSSNSTGNYKKNDFSSGGKLLENQVPVSPKGVTSNSRNCSSHECDHLADGGISQNNLNISNPADDRSQLEYTVELIPSPNKQCDISSSDLRQCAQDRNHDFSYTVKTTFTNNSLIDDKMTTNHETLEHESLTDQSQTFIQSEQTSEKFELQFLENYPNCKSDSSVATESYSSKAESITYPSDAVQSTSDALQSTLKVVNCMQSEDNQRAEKQITLLKLQEHSLIQEAKAKMQIINDEGGPNVRRRQRAAWHQLKVQLSHIRCLMETQVAAADQKRLIYQQYLQLLGSSAKPGKSCSLPENYLKARGDSNTDRQTQLQTNQADDSLETASINESLSVEDPLNCKDSKCLQHRQTDDGDRFAKMELSPIENSSVNVREKSVPSSGVPEEFTVHERVKENGQNLKYAVSLIPQKAADKTETHSIVQTYLQTEHTDRSSISGHDSRPCRRLPSTLRMSLSPKVTFNPTTRRQSSESDDSFTLSQNETASDVSDCERRLLTLKEELSAVKGEAERLYREKRRLLRERTASQERALQTQIAVYNNYITRTKIEVEAESRTLDLSGVKPMIKKRFTVKEGSSGLNPSFKSSIKDADTASEHAGDERRLSESLTAAGHPDLQLSDVRSYSIDTDFNSSVGSIGLHLTDDSSNSQPSTISPIDKASLQKDVSTGRVSGTISDNDQTPVPSRKLFLNDGVGVSPVRGEASNQLLVDADVNKQEQMPHQLVTSGNRSTSQSEGPLQLTTKLAVLKWKGAADQISSYLYNIVLKECTQDIVNIFVRKDKRNANSQNYNQFETKSVTDTADCLPSSVVSEPGSEQGGDEDFAKVEYFHDCNPPETEAVPPQNGVNPKTYLEELERLKEIFPDLVLREVPNKPPPPYTPPKNVSPAPPVNRMAVVSDFEVPFVERTHTYRQNRNFSESLITKPGSIIPIDAGEILKLVRSFVEHVSFLCKGGKALDNIHYTVNIFRGCSRKCGKEVNTFHRLIFDLSKHHMKESCLHSATSPAHTNMHRWVDVIGRKVRQSLSKEATSQRETSLTQWAKTKQDKVGRVIIEGIIAEEQHWVNVCDTNIANYVMSTISDHIFSSLIDETVSSFEKVLSSKVARLVDNSST